MTREEAKEVLGDVSAYLASRASLENEMIAGHTFIDICNAIKALKQEPKTGHWKRISMDKYVQHAMAYYRCSECGKDIIGEHNYCPNCGAKMKEGD